MIWQVGRVRSGLSVIPIVGITSLLVSGCTGTGHQLPKITDAERARALLEITSAPDLKPSTRTSDQNERIARRVLGKLQTAAKPVCKQVKRDNCWYTLEYSRKSSVNAGISQNRMVFTDGLAQHLENEDEFAAVIGHEIGHHLAFHYEEDAENRAIGSIIATVLFGGLAAATGVYQNNPGAFQSDLGKWYGAGATIGLISFSKEQESEADYLGAYLMTRGGYNPEEGKKVWIKLTKESGRMRTDLLDSHPAGPDRLAAWYKTLEEVRYSADLMPNPVGAKGEPRLQIARSFDGSAQPASQVAAVTAETPQVAAVTAETQKVAAATAETPKVAAVAIEPPPEAPTERSAPAPARSAGSTGNALVLDEPADDPADQIVSGTVAAERAVDYAAVANWAGLGGPLPGRLAMIETGKNQGELDLELENAAGGPAIRCEGAWDQKRFARDLVIGTWSMTCDNGRSAEGKYRLADDRDGLAGLHDSLGNFVELKLTRL